MRLVLVFMLTIALAASVGYAEVGSAVQMLGRVYVLPNYGIFETEYRRWLAFFHGDEWKAAQLANGSMLIDEENRLSDALDELRAVDPTTFDRVLHQHGLELRPRTQ